MNTELIEALIRTEALRIAQADEVYWYTSGTVGPYYINTHYLLGGAATAENFLAFIDSDKEDRERFAAMVVKRLQATEEPIH